MRRETPGAVPGVFEPRERKVQMLRNLSIRWQILAALALPLLVLIAVGGRVSYQSVQDMHDAREALDLSSTASSVTELVRGLGSERLLTVGVLSGSTSARTQLGSVRSANDVRLQRIGSDIEDAGLSPTYLRVLTSSSAGHARLAALRTAVDGGTVTAQQAAVRYTDIVGADVALPAEIAARLPDRATAANFRRFGVLSADVEALSQEQLTGLMIATAGHATLQQQRDLEAAQALQRQLVTDFGRGAPSGQRSALTAALASRAGQTKQLDALRSAFLAEGTSTATAVARTGGIQLDGDSGPSQAATTGTSAAPTSRTATTGTGTGTDATTGPGATGTGATSTGTSTGTTGAGGTGAGTTGTTGTTAAQGAASTAGVSPARWVAVTGARIGALNTVLDTIARDGVTNSSDELTSARLRAEVTAGAAAAAVLIMLLAAMLMARRISQPLRRLTMAATEIRDGLPLLVEQVQSGGDVVIEAPAVPVKGRNEVGRLASAFVDVNRVALQVAREQAQLRAAVSDMFVNVARRNQVLLARQLAFIDLLERNEANPDALEELFRLDHLATRMRRNAESLLVLAGIESGRRLREPMLLSDAIRTATSEIEHYERVSLALGTDPSVFAHLALPVAHLLAELLENATNFSEPGSTVVVMAAASPDGVRVTIADDGLGIAADELDDINARIENPPAADALGSQRLGFFVVGRLAQRLEAKVLLTSGRAGGTAVLIDLPASLFVEPEAPALPDPERQIVMAPELDQAEAAMAMELSSQLDGPGLHDLLALDVDQFGESPFAGTVLGADFDEHAEPAQAYGVGQAAPMAEPSVVEPPVAEPRVAEPAVADVSVEAPGIDPEPELPVFEGPAVFPADLSAEAYGALDAPEQGYQPETPAPSTTVAEPAESLEPAWLRLTPPEPGSFEPEPIRLTPPGPVAYEPGTTAVPEQSDASDDVATADAGYQPLSFEPRDPASDLFSFEPRHAEFDAFGTLSLAGPAEPSEAPAAPVATDFFRRRPAPVDEESVAPPDVPALAPVEPPVNIPDVDPAAAAEDSEPAVASRPGLSLFSGFRSLRQPVGAPEPDASDTELPVAYQRPSHLEELAHDEPQQDQGELYQPSFFAPPNQSEPTVAELIYAEPTDAQPSFAEPTFAEPTFVEPTFADSTYTEPTFADSTYPESPYPEPAHAGPVTEPAEPGLTRPEPTRSTEIPAASDVPSSHPVHFNEQPHTFAPDYGTPEHSASLQQPLPPLNEVPVPRDLVERAEAPQVLAPPLPDEPAPWENFIRRDILPQKPASLRDALRFGRRSPAPAPAAAPAADPQEQSYLLPGGLGRPAADAPAVPLMRRYRDDGSPRPTDWPAPGDTAGPAASTGAAVLPGEGSGQATGASGADAGPGWASEGPARAGSADAPALTWANSGLIGAGPGEDAGPGWANSAPAGTGPDDGSDRANPGQHPSPAGQHTAEPGQPGPGLDRKSRAATGPGAAEQGAGWPESFAVPAHLAGADDHTAVPSPRSGGTDSPGIAGFGATGARSDAQNRSQIASQALSELSRLSSYSPAAMETSDRGGLQRRTPAPVPRAPEPAVQSSSQRARTAANVRAMLSGFKAGVERGRTSPRSRSGPADRARDDGGSGA